MKRRANHLVKSLKSALSGFSREVQVVIIASFFVALGFGIIFPAIPVFVRSFGVNNTAVGLVVSAFAFARFSSGMISGRLVDRFGERNIYSFGVLMVSFFTVLAGLAQNYPQLLTFRAAGGLGSSMFSVASSSLIFRATDDAHRARALSALQGSFLVGGISGPAIGGALATISLRAPFFAYAFMLAIAGIIGYIYLGRAEAARSGVIVKAQDPITFREAFQIPAYRIALALSFIIGWAFFGMRSSILPLFVTESLDSTAAIVGIGFAIGAANALFMYPHFLGEEFYGLTSYILSCANVIFPLMAFGVHNTLVKFFSEYKSEKEKTQFLSFVLVLPFAAIIPIAIVGTVFYDGIAQFLSTEPYENSIYPRIVRCSSHCLSSASRSAEK